MAISGLCRAPRDPILRDLVKEIWVLRSEEGDAAEILPAAPSAELVFSLGADTVWTRSGGEKAELRGHFLSGPRTGYRSMRSKGGVHYVAASLKPGAAARLFGPESTAWSDEDIEAGLLSRTLADALEEIAAALACPLESGANEDAADTDAARIDMLEAWLAGRRLHEPSAEDARLSSALGLAAAGRCRARSVAELADHLGVGCKRLERASFRLYGLGPKSLLRLGRFERAQKASAPGREVNWADLALELGFADQSHLVREFRALSSLSPEAWRLASAS
jgi:AraC-like DNA-binding protein